MRFANSDDGNPLHLRTALRLLMKTTATRFIFGWELRFANEDDGNPLHLWMELRFANEDDRQPASSLDGVEVC